MLLVALRLLLAWECLPALLLLALAFILAVALAEDLPFGFTAAEWRTARAPRLARLEPWPSMSTQRWLGSALGIGGIGGGGGGTYSAWGAGGAACSAASGDANPNASAVQARTTIRFM